LFLSFIADRGKKATGYDSALLKSSSLSDTIREDRYFFWFNEIGREKSSW
jgi:hypothetical protein